MDELKFEEALKKLESIVEGLEQGKTSLEDSIKKYEEGIKLAKFCTAKLDEAEKKIEILTKESSGKLKKEPFEINPPTFPPSIDTCGKDLKNPFIPAARPRGIREGGGIKGKEVSEKKDTGKEEFLF